MRDRHGPGKTFSYVATCKKLKNPVVVKRGDAEYTIKYQYFAEPCKLNSTEVKTMTGGELALVGGKLTFTGKKLLRGGYDDDEYKEKEEFEIDGGDEDEEFQEEVEKVEKDEEVKKAGEAGEAGEESVDTDTSQSGGGKKKSKAKKEPAKKAPAKKGSKSKAKK